jgi:signal transduction histidine kinase
MNRLIADLLDVARLEAGQKLTIQTEPLDVRGIVAETCDGLTAEAERKGVHLDGHVDEGLPAVNGDKHRLLQVLANLVGNALKFTPEGGHVSVTARGDKDGNVVVSVKDSGAGIAPQHLAQVFNPYWQARQTARLGAGSGWPSPRGSWRRTAGRIWATSTPGTGSTFAFSLPPLAGNRRRRRARTPRSAPRRGPHGPLLYDQELPRADVLAHGARPVRPAHHDLVRRFRAAEAEVGRGSCVLR